MFLRTARAVDFVRTLPEWDGKTLIVFGRSQGGAQALAAAALVPEITLCVANVPALADHAGFTAGRQPGWPNLCKQQKNLLQPSSYVDVANLASRIRCRTRLTAGMIDNVCPPSSVTLVKNRMSAPVELHYFQNLSHNAPPADNDGRKLISGEINK